MTEELLEGVYRIGVPLAGNPLRELNSYFIRGDAFDLLIDTGFRTAECEAALAAGLKELHSEKARRRVLLTHFHADHSGMADIFAGEDQPIMIGEDDFDGLVKMLDGSFRSARFDRFMKEGFPAELTGDAFERNPATTQRFLQMTPQFTPLAKGSTLRVGQYALENIPVPGHTPGNCMYYIRDRRIMFTGDHVLFDITPNITCWPSMENALGSYLQSLRLSASYPVETALPGHRKSGNYAERIEELLRHHENRLAEAETIIRESPGLSAYEITARMRWRIHAKSWEDFPTAQKYFAVGECLSHLDLLCIEKRVLRTEENGTYRYYAAE